MTAYGHLKLEGRPRLLLRGRWGCATRLAGLAEEALIRNECLQRAQPEVGIGGARLIRCIYPVSEEATFLEER